MEKLSSTPRRLVLGGLVAGIAIAVVLLALLVGKDPAPERSPQATQPAAPAASRGLAESFPSNDPEADPLARPPVTPPELIAKILKKDAKLALFMEYHKNVLLDGPRRDEYRKLLSDPEMMNAMAEGLMNPGSGPAEPEEQYHRLMQIDYLEAALNWKENPRRQELLELTGTIISRDNFSNDQPKDRREMLAGGKMELYRLMYGQDGAKTAEMVAAAKGTRMEALVGWMAEENLRRAAKEEEIRKEMEALQAKEP